MGSRREQRSGLALFLTVSVLSAALAVSYSSGQLVTNVRFSRQPNVDQDVGEPGDEEISFPQTFTLADVNDDDSADLASVNTLGARVLVNLSRGDGTFEDPIELTPEIEEFEVDPSCIAVGDVGSSFSTGSGPGPDGNPDLVVGTIDGEIVIFVGDGEGNFELRTEDVLETDLTDVIAIKLADFNDDGDLDIAALGSFDEAVVLISDDGNFDPDTETFATDADTAIDMAAGDIDGDDETDLVVLDQENRTISLLLGLGDGDFEDPVEESTVSDSAEPDQVPMALAFADLEEDGEGDVVILNFGVFGELTLLVRRGPDLNSSSSFTAPSEATGFVLVDVDGNGILDALISHEGNVSPAYLPDDGGSGFVETGPFNVGFAPGLAIASANFGGDDLPDFVQLNRDGNGFIVGLNVSNDPTPTGGTLPPGDTPTAGPSGTPTPTVPTNTPTPTATATPIPTFPLSFCEIPISGIPTPVRPVDVDWGLFDDNQFNDIAVADRNGRVLLFLIDQEMPFPMRSDCMVEMGNAASNLTLRAFDVSNGTPAALAVGPLVGGVTAATGRRDVAVVGGSFLTVFYGDGQGGLQEQLSRDLGGDLRSVVIGDINLDNNNDIVIADRGGNSLKILYGDGGTFNSVVPVTPGPVETGTPSPGRTPGPPSFVLAAKFDGDTYLDLAEASADGRTVAVRFQDALNPGQFRSVTTVGSEQLGSGNPTALATGHFNSDSVLDLAVTMTTGTPPDQVVILVGVESAGQITYQRLSTVDTDAGPTDVGVGGFSNMGGNPLQHIITTNIGDNTVSFYEAPPGAPIKPLNSADLGDTDGRGPAALTIADFDGDDDLDVVIANRDSGTLTIFRSQVAPSTPTPLPTATSTATGTVTRTGTITASPTQSGTPTMTPLGTATVTATRTATATHTKSPKPGTFGLSDGGCGITQTSTANAGGFALLWVVGVLFSLRRDFAGRTKRGGS